MRLFKTLGITLIAFSAFHIQSASVWQVTSENNTLYIGGTVHMLTPQDYPLPSEYDTAYRASDKLIFETNIDALNSTENQQKLAQVIMANDGITLDHKLSNRNITALKLYLESRNVSFSSVQNFNPSFLSIYISIIELKHLGFTDQGVDWFYEQKAAQDNKPQTWLEEVEEQLAMLTSLEAVDHDTIIEYGLAELNKMPQAMDDIRSSWRSGDMDALAEVGLTELLVDYPNIYKTLLADRNHDWLPQIETMLDDDLVEFVLVGAMHLAGPDSVLMLLENKGYKVSKL
ncbi:TraB/GumN family protein [Marinomonas sp.]|nr:TraB/GumN family protein [Marinomonas sp.]MDB4836929.1 TraB/GumN family protein [Marinomonas sp.]